MRVIAVLFKLLLALKYSKELADIYNLQLSMKNMSLMVIQVYELTITMYALLNTLTNLFTVVIY